MPSPPSSFASAESHVSAWSRSCQSTSAMSSLHGTVPPTNASADGATWTIESLAPMRLACRAPTCAPSAEAGESSTKQATCGCGAMSIGTVAGHGPGCSLSSRPGAATTSARAAFHELLLWHPMPRTEGRWRGTAMSASAWTISHAPFPPPGRAPSVSRRAPASATSSRTRRGPARSRHRLRRSAARALDRWTTGGHAARRRHAHPSGGPRRDRVDRRLLALGGRGAGCARSLVSDTRPAVPTGPRSSWATESDMAGSLTTGDAGPAALDAVRAEEAALHSAASATSERWRWPRLVSGVGCAGRGRGHLRGER